MSLELRILVVEVEVPQVVTLLLVRVVKDVVALVVKVSLF